MHYSHTERPSREFIVQLDLNNGSSSGKVVLVFTNRTNTVRLTINIYLGKVFFWVNQNQVI